MYKTITIGEKEVGMLANAASPFLYKQIFKEDFLLEIQKKNPDVGAIVKIGFVMAMQAEKKTAELMKLTEEDFLRWLEQFEAMDLYAHAGEMMDAYIANTKTTAVPKKRAIDGAPVYNSSLSAPMSRARSSSVRSAPPRVRGRDRHVDREEQRFGDISAGSNARRL